MAFTVEHPPHYDTLFYSCRPLYRCMLKWGYYPIFSKQTHRSLQTQMSRLNGLKTWTQDMDSIHGLKTKTQDKDSRQGLKTGTQDRDSRQGLNAWSAKSSEHAWIYEFAQRKWGNKPILACIHHRSLPWTEEYGFHRGTSSTL
jgi:hypothetical protein